MKRKYGMRDGGFTGQKPQKLVGNQTKLDANKLAKMTFHYLKRKRELLKMPMHKNTKKKAKMMYGGAMKKTKKMNKGGAMKKTKKMARGGAMKAKKMSRGGPVRRR